MYMGLTRLVLGIPAVIKSRPECYYYYQVDLKTVIGLYFMQLGIILRYYTR